MKHSDAIKAMLLMTINEIAADPHKYAVNPGKDFTRNRKMRFYDTIMMLLTMEADCIKEEIYRYFGRNLHAPSISDQGKQELYHRNTISTRMLLCDSNSKKFC